MSHFLPVIFIFSISLEGKMNDIYNNDQFICTTTFRMYLDLIETIMIFLEKLSSLLLKKLRNHRLILS
jgi:hypothetical protein